MNLNFNITVATIFLLTSFAAEAEYKFSEINWGDSPEVASRKLAEKGYKSTFVSKAACKLDAYCAISFSGPSVPNGKLVFSNNRLYEVRLDTKNFDGTLQALTKRYGQHLPWKPSYRDPLFGRPNVESKVFNWPEISGSTLLLDEDGHVIYSGDPPRSPADKSGYSNF